MKNDNWTTPNKLFEFQNSRFNFTVDAAASSKNTKCDSFFNKKENFLKVAYDSSCLWQNVRIFCNPPYSLDKEFAEACLYLYQNFKVPSYLLLPQRGDRIWYNKLLKQTKGVRNEPFTGRIHFGNAKSGAFMYNIGVIIGFKECKTFPYLDAGQFNNGGRGSATT